jgi:hypothetical protein
MNNIDKWEGNYLLLYNKDGVNLMNNNVKWEGNYLLLYIKDGVNLMIIMVNEEVFIY